MKIALAMITKDDSEVESLERCLNSIQNYVDDVYLTVTRPNQTKIAKLAKERNIHLSEFHWEMGKEPWKNWDFSKARNFNFSQVKDADYILWLDSDDIFVGGEYIREVAQNALDGNKDEVFFSYWYGCTFDGEPSPSNLKSIDLEHLRERLIKPNRTTWKGKLHETPVPLEGIKNTYTLAKYDAQNLPLAVMHTLTHDQSTEKLERNKTILEIQLEEEGNNKDPRTLLYLMKIYAELDGEYLDKCLEYGKLYVEKSGWDEEICSAYEIMGNVWGKKGDNKKASECYLKGIDAWPYQPLVYIRLAQSYFNLKRYKECKHWLNIAMEMDLERVSTGMTNYTAMKALSSELMLKLAFQVDKDTKKALEAAKLLYTVDPIPEHAGTVEYLENVNRLNDACGDADKLCTYLEDIGEDALVPKLIDLLPTAISSQPFAIKLRQKNSIPRKWGEKEICYFANFGGQHFEKWDGNSLKTGIGGSETAVIRLAEEWTKKGYKVAVYGDPEKPCEVNGVVYLPWYWFNRNDEFNIFIQWRGSGLAGKIKTKKFLVDLHDIFNEGDHIPVIKDIDKIMVKSKFHRNLAPNIPDDKFVTISNGI